LNLPITFPKACLHALLEDIGLNIPSIWEDYCGAATRMQKSHDIFFKTRGFPGIPRISRILGINQYPGKDYRRMYNMAFII